MTARETETLGKRTAALLRGHGLDDSLLKSIEKGDVAWDLVEREGEDGTPWSDLILSHCEGGQRYEATLTKSQTDELLDSWDFERRHRPGIARPGTFAEGGFGTWIGIPPESDWRTLIRSYRSAASLLSSARHVDVTAVYLFVCRHTLELQLKASVMLGQQALGVDADLPAHHDLRRLWTAALPVLRACGFHRQRTEIVGQVVEDFHAVDPTSFNFRYPVTRNNRPIEHAPFVHAFDSEQLRDRFSQAADALDDFIRILELSILLGRAERPSESPG